MYTRFSGNRTRKVIVLQRFNCIRSGIELLFDSGSKIIMHQHSWPPVHSTALTK